MCSLNNQKAPKQDFGIFATLSITAQKDEGIKFLWRSKTLPSRGKAAAQLTNEAAAFIYSFLCDGFC